MHDGEAQSEMVNWRCKEQLMCSDLPLTFQKRNAVTCQALCLDLHISPLQWKCSCLQDVAAAAAIDSILKLQCLNCLSPHTVVGYIPLCLLPPSIFSVSPLHPHLSVHQPSRYAPSRSVCLWWEDQCVCDLLVLKGVLSELTQMGWGYL